jgi:[ribosomal protein S5]-alanine N-acetyltransferase
MTSLYPIYLETPRLRLREMQRTDALPIWNFNQTPIHRQYEPDMPRSYEDFLGIVEWIISAQQERPRQYYYVVATLKSQPEVVLGSVHITQRDFEHRQGEIGYSFDSTYWNQGYCTEASLAMRDFAFDTLGVHRLFADGIVEQNLASIRIAEKLGMRPEAHFREALYFQERWWNTLVYAMTESEWWEGKR